MIVRVVRSSRDHREYTVELKQGCQSVRLDISRPRSEARWFKKQFETMLRRHDAERTEILAQKMRRWCLELTKQ